MEDNLTKLFNQTLHLDNPNDYVILMGEDITWFITYARINDSEHLLLKYNINLDKSKFASKKKHKNKKIDSMNDVEIVYLHKLLKNTVLVLKSEKDQYVEMLNIL